LIICDAISLRFCPSQTHKPKASHYVTTVINDLRRDIGIAETKDRVPYISVRIPVLSFTEKHKVHNTVISYFEVSLNASNIKWWVKATVYVLKIT